MQYLGVIVGPGKTSISPAFQEAALEALDLPYKYVAWPTPADGLETRVTGLRAPSVRGANVTIPHKEAVIRFLDEVDGLVLRVGAVNTITNEGGRLLGSNTDVTGFLRALREDAGFDPGGCRAVVAGAGGAARAVAVALIEAGAASITIVNRTRKRAERLVADLSRYAEGTRLAALPDTPESWAQAGEGATLLVNCTSLGTAGTPEADRTAVPAEVIRPEMLVYDLVYRPAETRLLREARARGARTLGGLPMLVYQGAASFKTWTGRDAPVGIMLDAARKAIGETD
jgi:shikimate dehydrogenase